MRTTIDAAGRIVVPKAIREAMGLRARQEVDIVFTDGRIEIELPAATFRIEKKGKVGVIVPDQDMPELTDEMIRDTLESIRR
jgi:AbrB family looped-hinge helix DNA binding protein